MKNEFRPVDPIPLRRPQLKEIEWARLLKRLTVGGEVLQVGTVVSGEQLAKWNPQNFWGLVQTRALHYGLKNTPIPTQSRQIPISQPAVEGKMMVVNKGFGKFDIIKGVIVATDLTKAEAVAMAETGNQEPAPEKKTDAA